MTVAAALFAQMLLIVGLFYERRRRRRAEAQSHQRMSELAHMSRSATAGELSASIAHEITQPLQAITSNGNAGLSLLAATTPDLPDLREAREAFQDIVDEARRASDVLGTIRSMFKKGDQEKVALNINVVIGEVLALLHSDFLRRKILLQTRLGADLPLVRGNRVQLQQVFLNLCVNAADAMDSMIDRDRKLTVMSERQNSSGVLITVEDSRPGIEPKNTERIFEPFYTTKPSGMGMGLSICRSIIEEHEGRLLATPGRFCGLAMQIFMPITVASEMKESWAEAAE
jgi:C4-dicarboxylate-specific signal transduction histidine kinase